jgi:hypothetical protein
MEGSSMKSERYRTSRHKKAIEIQHCYGVHRQMGGDLIRVITATWMDRTNKCAAVTNDSPMYLGQ